MAIAPPKITENDVVKLVRPVKNWPAGTQGTAVSDHGASKLVEISDDYGQMLDLVEVLEVDLTLISQYPSQAA
jgi:hypothetical protein